VDQKKRTHIPHIVAIPFFFVAVNRNELTGVFLFYCRLFLSARPEPSSSEELDYAACVEKSLVVSEVFCLPQGYRKDVPPSSECKRTLKRTWLTDRNF
jgi:hypothetical protein